MTPLEKNECIYLYCLARKTGLLDEAVSIPDKIDSVSFLSYKDIMIAVKNVLIDEWTGHAGEKNLQDLKWVGPRACHHQEVIENIMKYSPVFPAGFGTLFSSADKLKTLIEKHYHKISDFLNYMSDKEEWSVKGFVDKAKAEEQIFISLSGQTKFSSSQGVRYLQEQQLRVTASKKVNSCLQEIKTNIAEILKPISLEFNELKKLSQESSGRNTDMIFNWAFLLSKENIESFLCRIKQLENIYSKQGIILEITGEWPPYSFCFPLADL